MRIPLDRMTNWELIGHLERWLRMLDDFGEHDPEVREVLLDLSGAIEEAEAALRKIAKAHATT